MGSIDVRMATSSAPTAGAARRDDPESGRVVAPAVPWLVRRKLSRCNSTVSARDQDLGSRLSASGPDGPSPGVAAPVADPQVRVRLAPRYKVFVHNDDITPMWFVTRILQGIFGLEEQRAEQVMLEAHTNGVAFVVALSLEQAEFRVEQAHSMARAARYPLTFTYEPE
jgi:ATP-dependent Clp protease adaptor protein ClpS